MALASIGDNNGDRALHTPVKSYSRIPDVLDLPNLILLQIDSFQWFQKDGLRELFDEISPIQDFTGNKLELSFLDYEFRPPKYTEDECHDRDMTFSAPLFVTVRLTIKETGEKIDQPIFMGDFPLMTDRGTFIINGAERVVVSQLVRSPGVYFTTEDDTGSGRPLAYGKLIPNRGAWLEFETSNRDLLSAKIDRRRKIPLFLRAVGYGTDEELLTLFQDVDDHPDHQYIASTIEKDPCKNQEDAQLEFYKRLRPGDPPNPSNALGLINALFFTPRRYDLGRVGRYKLNKRLGLAIPQSQRILTKEDLVAITRKLIEVNKSPGLVDDIDHLGNRRIRAVGELIQNQFRVGLLRMERVIRERMTITDPQQATPSSLINMRPVVAAVKEFFGGSQLSQFMDQTNPLAELTHKRRLSALGPGGLSRDRAGFDVRDVHHSHYGRICPIETPEGPNIGLIGSLATYGRVNEYGFIEAPYRRVIRELPNASLLLEGQTLEERIEGSGGHVIAEKGAEITPSVMEQIAALPPRQVKVVPFVSDEIEYLSADREEEYHVAQANSRINKSGQFVDSRVEARYRRGFLLAPPNLMDYMDVSPKQIVSVATSLIPFLEHDDANRALMGSNMQRQAVPLVRPQVPLVGTGMERRAAMDSGQVVFSRVDGVVSNVTSTEIIVTEPDGVEHRYRLAKFKRSNQGTCFNQRAIVSPGEIVKRGQPLADSSSTDQGDLALGQNVLCAFMSWEGCNFEDAIVINQNLVKEDKFSSIHVEKHEVEARDTKLGPEEITRDIPNVGEESLRDLDELGIIRVGAEVGPGDILVGKITPKGETELTAEEKLLRAIFGEKAREVKDTSLRVPHGERGKVIEVRVFSRAQQDELPPGVNQMVRVSIGQVRKVSEGDKMAGRHGNKGVISRILPVEDMPYLADGTAVEIILNPIGVPSRMNVGQVLEAHLGLAAEHLGFRVVSPVFDGASEADIQGALCRAWLIERAALDSSNYNQVDQTVVERTETAKAWLSDRGYDGGVVFSEIDPGEAKRVALKVWVEEQGGTAEGLDEEDLEKEAHAIYKEKNIAPPTFGRVTLYDGRTGEPFARPVTVGSIYMMKLVHLVEDKIHARSTGPYSLITQQPLGGKAQFGGQRFGEMEVWALEAYGAAHILRELLTVKSDDVLGRVKTYEAVVKGEDIVVPGVPESFKVLVKELQSLGLSVEVLNEDEEQVPLIDDTSVEIPELGIDLTGMEKGEF
ncbi:MAG: DNA-directed polymerase beta subunit [Dehalococcoidia bacterium]|nr:DNA-directed polymerase beta subunit [Dehalococcoidia bacterium]